MEALIVQTNQVPPPVRVPVSQVDSDDDLIELWLTDGPADPTSALAACFDTAGYRKIHLGESLAFFRYHIPPWAKPIEANLHLGRAVLPLRR